jgi:hypothetical protein
VKAVEILRSPRRWHELPAWARRRWRTRDPLLPGLLAGKRATLDRCTFDLSSTSLCIRSRFATGRYEAPERKLARELLDPALPVIELGGCIGVLGCIVNRMLREPRRHVVVEANGALLDAIERHRALNGAEFVVEHAAIGYGAREVELHIHPRLVTASSAHKHGFARYQLLCDIEGAEQQLIETEAARPRRDGDRRAAPRRLRRRDRAEADRVARSARPSARRLRRERRRAAALNEEDAHRDAVRAGGGEHAARCSGERCRCEERDRGERACCARERRPQLRFGVVDRERPRADHRADAGDHRHEREPAEHVERCTVVAVVRDVDERRTGEHEPVDRVDDEERRDVRHELSRVQRRRAVARGEDRDQHDAERAVDLERR